MKAEIIHLDEKRTEREMLCLDEVWNACGRKRGCEPTTRSQRKGKRYIEDGAKWRLLVHAVSVSFEPLCQFLVCRSDSAHRLPGARAVQVLG